MRDSLTIKCHSLSETKSLAGCFALLLRAGLVVGLQGPLGVGKSAFARYVIQGSCGEAQEVPSPTFTLVQSYETQAGLPVMHMDLYRLEAPEEAFELGVEDSFYEAANLVEWPSKMGGFWPADAASIEISFADEDARLFEIAGDESLIGPLRELAKKAGLALVRPA